MGERASSGRYLRLLIRDYWAPLMSGGFSVPFAALAVFADSKFGQIIWGAMAVSAGLFSGYLVWAKEHAEVRRLNEVLRPRLKLSLIDERDPHKPEDMANLPGQEPGTHPGHFIHLWPQNLSPFPLRNGTVQLRSIERDESGQWKTAGSHINGQPLRWASASPEDRFVPRDLIPGARQLVDLFNVGERDQMLKLNVREVYPSPFFEKGIYRIRALVSAEGAPTEQCSVIVEWTGNWRNFNVYPGSKWEGDDT
jgi:hypothetical protein